MSAPNRIFMDPVTRARTSKDLLANTMLAEHQAQRATGGLPISEAAMYIEGHSTFWREPSNYSPSFVAGWKLVTDALHAKGTLTGKTNQAMTTSRGGGFLSAIENCVANSP